MTRKLLYTSLLPIWSTNHFDKVKEEAGAVSSVNNESGKDRLLRALQTNEFGETSPELNSVLQVGCMSMFIGALYGGVLSSRTAYMDFFQNNQATIFRDHIEAKKRLHDKVTLAFGKGALRWAWRLTFFSTTYVGVSTGISVYRGKSGILEHLVAGSITGTLYKFNMGPRGWMVGCGLGLVLGLVAGSTTLGLLKLSGMTMEDVRYWNSQWTKKRTELHRENIKQHLEKEEAAIFLEHSKKFENANKSLDSIE